MATYGNLSLSELIVYNSAGDASANLQFDNTNTDGNFAMNTGLDITGGLTIINGSNSGTISYNTASPADLNFSMNHGLDVAGSTNFNGLCTVNGNLNVTGSTSINNNLTVNGTNNFTGTTNISGSSITINGGALTIDMPNGGATITFPGSFSTTTPIVHPSTGLGIYWNGIQQQGETDLISYGQGGVGGFSLFSVNDSPSSILTLIANFFPNGSTIYSSLDISGNSLTLSNEGSYSVLSITPGSLASSTLLGVSTSLQIGSNTTEPNCYLQIQNGDVSGNLSINATDGNFDMTTGLDVSGNLTLDGSLNTFSSLDVSGNLNVIIPNVMTSGIYNYSIDCSVYGTTDTNGYIFLNYFTNTSGGISSMGNSIIIVNIFSNTGNTSYPHQYDYSYGVISYTVAMDITNGITVLPQINTNSDNYFLNHNSNNADAGYYYSGTEAYSYISGTSGGSYYDQGGNYLTFNQDNYVYITVIGCPLQSAYISTSYIS
jgi:hypothetical protein